MEDREDVRKDIRVLNVSIQRLTQAVQQLTDKMQNNGIQAPRRRIKPELVFGLLFLAGLVWGAIYLLLSIKH